MKKNLLIVLCLFLSLSSIAFAADTKIQPTETEVKQKACQNVFSLINIDLSFMSPRATVADVNTPPCPMPSKGGIVPISDKTGKVMPPPAAGRFAPPAPPASTSPAKNKTSFFRIDLLGIFKIQIL